MTSTISFTAIDFETANEFRGSACAVGLAKVVNGTVVDEKSLLFKPPEGHQRFDPFNTLIHG
ncbi:MAG TPA: exonuclease, partial [Acidimicrobiia bacterium]|nr:exonuclease [Acidimicrobiia bacterium]